MRNLDDPWVIDRRMQELIYGIDDVYDQLSPNQKVKSLYAIVKLWLPFYEVIQKGIFQIFQDKEFLNIDEIAIVLWCLKKLKFNDKVYMDLTKQIVSSLCKYAIENTTKVEFWSEDNDPKG